ncbi:MAG TPA: hypothetical protein VEJ87_11410 [Acidimicrobiales bacterium]|nr:hypothetical protein [Acidimicrobiales bacterium]
MGREEGWYTDPYARHQERWMSDGRPTRLVRDNGAESSDVPPDGPFEQTPQPVETDEATDSDNLRRDDSDQDSDGFDAFDPAWPI